MSDKKEKLRRKLIEFLQVQPGYTNMPRKKIRATFPNKELYIITYGDEVTSITGSGATVDLAFDDFVKSWISLKGFEWFEKNK